MPDQPYELVEKRPCLGQNLARQRCAGEDSDAAEWRLCAPCRARRAMDGRAVGLEAGHIDSYHETARDRQLARERRKRQSTLL